MKNSQIAGIFALLLMGTFSLPAHADTRSVTVKPLFAKWPYVSRIVRSDQGKDSKMDCCKRATEACKMDCCK